MSAHGAGPLAACGTRSCTAGPTRRVSVDPAAREASGGQQVRVRHGVREDRRRRVAAAARARAKQPVSAALVEASRTLQISLGTSLGRGEAPLEHRASGAAAGAARPEQPPEPTPARHRAPPGTLGSWGWARRARAWAAAGTARRRRECRTLPKQWCLRSQCRRSRRWKDRSSRPRVPPSRCPQAPAGCCSRSRPAAKRKRTFLPERCCSGQQRRKRAPSEAQHAERMRTWGSQKECAPRHCRRRRSARQRRSAAC